MLGFSFLPDFLEAKFYQFSSIVCSLFLFSFPFLSSRLFEYFKINIFILSVCLMCVLSVHMSMLGDLGGQKRSPGTGVIDSCKPPHGCWDSNPCPWQEQQVLNH